MSAESFSVRPAGIEDMRALGDLLDDVFRRSRGITDQSMLNDFPLVFCEDNLSNTRIGVDGDRIVSHAALWPRRMMIEGTWIKTAMIVAVAYGLSMWLIDTNVFDNWPLGWRESNLRYN